MTKDDKIRMLREALEQAIYAMKCPAGHRAHFLVGEAIINGKQALSQQETEKETDGECHMCGGSGEDSVGVGDPGICHHYNGTGRQKEDNYEKALHNYLMDTQDDQMKKDVNDIMGDWAMDAFEAGWNACLISNQEEE